MTLHTTWSLNAKVLDAYVRNLRAYVSNAYLREYELMPLPNGAVDAHASAYARAYRLKGSNGSFACLRFWMNTAHVSILESYAKLERTPEVLRKCGLTQVKLLSEAIVIDEQAIPAILMDWVEGRSLSDTVTMHLNNESTLLQIAEALRSIFTSLNESRTSHGDLRSSNIITAIDKNLARVHLIDLDSLRWQGGPMTPRVMGGSGMWHEILQRESVSPLESDYLDQAATYLTVVALAAEKSWWRGPTDGFLFQHLAVELREVVARVGRMNTPAARVANAVRRAIETPGHWNEVAEAMRNSMGGSWTEATFWNDIIDGRASRTKTVREAPAQPATEPESKQAIPYSRMAPIQPPSRRAPWLWILMLITMAVITGLIYWEEISSFLAGLRLFR